MKYVILAIFLGYTQLFALSAYSSASDSAKKMTTTILKKLNIEESDVNKEKVYDRISYSLTDGWSAQWSHGRSLNSSKLAEEKNMFLDIHITTNERMYNFSLIHSKENNQLFIASKQFVIGSKSSGLNIVNKFKKNKEYVVNEETNNYVEFNKKGYMDNTNVLIVDAAALVNYSSFIVIDLDADKIK
jgi:hypothetical protein